MPILLLLLLTVACLLERFPPPPVAELVVPTPALCAVLTWAGVALLLLLAYVIGWLVRRQARSNYLDREHIQRRFANWRSGHMLAMVIFYGLALYVLGWGWTVQKLCEWLVPAQGSRALPLLPGAEFVILAPFLVMLVSSWAIFYSADRALHDVCRSAADFRPFWGRGPYVMFRARQNLALLFAPLVLIVFVKALQWFFSDTAADWVVEAVALLLLPTVFIGFPWVLRIILGLRPLPEGPLRSRLLATAERLSFRCSNILLWNTNGGVANAMVAGLLPAPRYVLLTDRLLSELSPDEVEAVFGHEVGHVKHRHIPYYLAFMLVSLWVVAGLWDFATVHVPVLKLLLPPTEDWTKVPFIGIVAAYIFVVFGFLSRRCERQADIFGCRAVSCGEANCQAHGPETQLLPGGKGLCATGIRVFIEALEKVARVNGMSRKRPGWLQSWQHSTIAHRVDFLEGVLADRTLEPRFQRTVVRVKWLLAVGLTIVFLILCGIEGWQNLRPF
jgi:Zn-dependent protease with chaperone function